MAFASIQDTRSIEQEMNWNERDVPETLFSTLSDTAEKYRNNNAVYISAVVRPTDTSETLSWRTLHEKITQTANMFRLGIVR